MHVLIIPTELYLPPLLPWSGIFQGHQSAVLASHGVQVGVVSYGYISWRQAFKRFPYPSTEHSHGANILRRFVRPAIPARFAAAHLRDQLVARSVRLVEEYVRRFGSPDIVHAHNTFSAGLVAARVQKELGIPFILTEHDSALARLLASSTNREAARQVFESAALVSAVGTTVARQMVAVSPETRGVCVRLGNVLDPAIEARARSAPPHRASGETSTFVFLAIGALIPIKNHALLLRAFSLAFKGNARITLRIGGQGPLAADLQTMAHALGIASQVRFLGYLDREQVIQELEHCDAMALSSLSETFGVVLIEALAFGKPVVSTRSGGPEDIVDERVGLLVNGDDASLAAGLERLYESSFDAEVIKQCCFGSWGAEAFWSRLRTAYDVALGHLGLSDVPDAWRVAPVDPDETGRQEFNHDVP